VRGACWKRIPFGQPILCNSRAALLTSEENPQGFSFVTLDRRLGGAAEKEGFRS
jgi:hypothetical protein